MLYVYPVIPVNNFLIRIQSYLKSIWIVNFSLIRVISQPSYVKYGRGLHKKKFEMPSSEKVFEIRKRICKEFDDSWFKTYR